ncbi:MAG: cytochrome c family protein [Gemmataceae bacterium]|nr:cytochrome c family protein [Gemmataceae bacterium]
MPQIFPKAANPLARMLVLILPMGFASTGVGLAAFYRSTYATGVNEIVPQPVAFSHKHHAGELGIHCLYCHTTVEDSHFANIPPTKTCMNCHQQMWTGSDLLAPVRASWATDTPIAWNRVHNVPHYAYFNHSAHVNKGVGCQSCHGNVDEMNLTWQSKTLLMEWCIDCHRNPEKNLRPLTEVFSMTWTPGTGGKWKPDDFPANATHTTDTGTVESKWQATIGPDRPTTQAELGKVLKEAYNVRDPVTLTSCSMCHR